MFPACLTLASVTASITDAQADFVIHSDLSACHCLPEFGKQRVMSQEANVLGVVVSLILPLGLFLRLPWVNTLKDAQAPAQQVRQAGLIFSMFHQGVRLHST